MTFASRSKDCSKSISFRIYRRQVCFPFHSRDLGVSELEEWQFVFNTQFYSRKDLKYLNNELQNTIKSGMIPMKITAKRRQYKRWAETRAEVYVEDTHWKITWENTSKSSWKWNKKFILAQKNLKSIHNFLKTHISHELFGDALNAWISFFFSFCIKVSIS